MQWNITKLLLAHHSDDQAETVLMRLAAGHSSNGLKAMSRALEIPECWGKHGVNQSGSFEKTAKRLSRFRQKELQYHDIKKSQHLESLLAEPPIFESGGIRILRPLLVFSKEQLRKTCEANAVNWEEDESNHDVSITTRNAVRNLLQNSRVPRALQKASLLQIADRERQKARHIIRAYRKMVEDCEILLFDTRSSVLVIRFPLNNLTLKEESKPFQHSIAAHCLREIAKAVSPQEDIAVASLASAAKLVFPDGRDSTVTPKSDVVESLTLTVGGVQLKRIYSQVETSKREQERRPRRGLDPNFIWVLSRQPFSQRPTPLIISPAPSQPSKIIHLKGTESPPNIQDLQQHWSAWQLWDGRYWIRIRNKSSRALVLRAWESHELRAIRDSVPRPKFDDFRGALKIAAPGKVRWNLPVIAEATIQETNGGIDINDVSSASDSTQSHFRDRNIVPGIRGKILVFPTLGKVGWLDILDENGDRKLEWEVRYKNFKLRHKYQKDSFKGFDSNFVTAWDDGGQGSVRLSTYDAGVKE